MRDGLKRRARRCLRTEAGVVDGERREHVRRHGLFEGNAQRALEHGGRNHVSRVGIAVRAGYARGRLCDGPGGHRHARLHAGRARGRRRIARDAGLMGKKIAQRDVDVLVARAAGQLRQCLHDRRAPCDVAIVDGDGRQHAGKRLEVGSDVPQVLQRRGRPARRAPGAGHAAGRCHVIHRHDGAGECGQLEGSANRVDDERDVGGCRGAAAGIRGPTAVAAGHEGDGDQREPPETQYRLTHVTLHASSILHMVSG